jgi:hypothetical protein
MVYFLFAGSLNMESRPLSHYLKPGTPDYEVLKPHDCDVYNNGSNSSNRNRSSKVVEIVVVVSTNGSGNFNNFNNDN